MSILNDVATARKSTKLSQAELAERSGLSRMTVQRMEAGAIDPRLSTVLELVRAMGLELMLVPTALRPELEAFVRSGGKLLGQPSGAGAPVSVVEQLTRPPANAKTKP